MPRIAGTDVPNDKRILISLTYIYGVGLTTSRAVLREARINEDTKTNKLSEEEIGHIAGVIDRNYVVEGQLRRQIKQKFFLITFNIFIKMALPTCFSRILETDR